VYFRHKLNTAYRYPPLWFLWQNNGFEHVTDETFKVIKYISDIIDLDSLKFELKGRKSLN